MRRSIDAKYGRQGMRLLMQVITVCLMLTLAGMFPGAYPAMAAPSGTGVGSVAELTAAINAGTSEIYLTSDLKIPGYVSFNNGKNMRLDLNGHTITLNSASTSRSCIMIKENSGLTICDTSSGQTGTITGAYRPAAAGGAICLQSGALTLEGGTIKENKAQNGGGIAVTSGTFTMNGGVIEKNYGMNAGGTAEQINQTGNGCGVYVYGGNFVMNGGSIRGNQSDNYKGGNGGGVYVGTGAVFTMNGGTIGGREVMGSGNSVVGDGGGVCVHGGTFHYNGGIIDSNHAGGNGGGICLGEGSSFSMKEGLSITANQANGYGGGIYINNAACQPFKNVTITDNQVAGGSGGAIAISAKQATTITMAGSSLQSNTASDSGGAIYIAGGGLSLSNVTIRGNVASTEDGGGICAVGTAVLSIAGSILTENEAQGGSVNSRAGAGGAIYLGDRVAALLQNTTITKNDAAEGGGIYVDTEAELSMENGTIQNNTTHYYYVAYSGAGVSVLGGMKISGKPVIKNNQEQGSKTGQTDVYLQSGGKLSIQSALLEGASIGVRSDSTAATIGISDGYSSYNWQMKPSMYFFSNDTAYAVSKNTSLGEQYADDSVYHEVYLMKAPCTHTGMTHIDTIPATCITEGTKEYYQCPDCGRLYEDAHAAAETKRTMLAIAKDPNHHEGGTRDEEDTTKRVNETCLEVGSKTYNEICDSCGKIRSTRVVPTPPLGHDWIESQDTVTGRTKWTCSRCQEVIWGNDPTCDHIIADIPETFATCTESGFGAYAECWKCHTLFEAGTEYNGSNIDDRVLTEIAYNDLMRYPLGHEEGADWIEDASTRVEPDCTEDGSCEEYTECTRCSVRVRQRTVTIPALGHAYSEPRMENCMQISECTRCHVIQTDGPYHVLVDVPEVEATCIGDGHQEVYACANCGTLIDATVYHTTNGQLQTEIHYSDIYLPALGHSFGAWSINEDPTAELKGSEVHICSRCGAAEGRMIDEVIYTFTKGDASVWKHGDSGSLNFIVKRSYKDEETFSTWYTGQVLVDGQTLSASDYTATKGSVDLKLSDSFLNRLELGAHTVTIVFDDAEMTADFTVAAGDGADESTHVTETSSTTDNQAKTSPRTGDGSCMERILLLMAAALLMISGAGVSLCKRGKRG